MLLIYISCSTNPHCLASPSPYNSNRRLFLFDGLYGLQCCFRAGKLSVFISVHQFEEIFSALIDSAVDTPDKLSSEDYFLFVCQARQQRQRQIQVFRWEPAWTRPLCSSAHGNREFWHCRYKGGTKNPGLQAQITFIKFINSKWRFKPTGSLCSASSPSSISLAFNAQVNSAYPEKKFSSCNYASLDGCVMKPTQLPLLLWQQSLNMISILFINTKAMHW